MTSPEELAAAVLFLIFSGKRRASADAGVQQPRTAANVNDGAALIARATQPNAARWVAIFENGGVPHLLAEAYARWAGIESSGNPLAVSSIGERGLFQATKTTALTEKAYTPAQWASLINPGTTNEEHAHLAQTLATWLYNRALNHIANPPTDYISAVWYAKMYHQRPVDVRDAKMHGPALPMAKELAMRWANDAAKMHRLRAANVVAFGVSDP